MYFRKFLMSGLALGALIVPFTAPACAAAPLRLAASLNAPDWLTLGGSYRLRYETLNGRFRAHYAGSDQILVERLLLAARVQFGAFYAGGELEDSRQQLADSGTHLGTDSVDAFEPLQFYAGLQLHNAFAPGDSLDIKGGRMTIDDGSRRLVARNRFRNTLNAFTGLDANWQDAGGLSVHAFYVLPVNRRPTSKAALLDNTVQLDSESFHTQFWGVSVTEPDVLGRASGEAYIFGLSSHDGPGLPVADRDLYTPGLRLYAKPKAGTFDYQIEAAMQFGTSRATTAASDTRNLSHLAGFIHLDAGYTWQAPWSPRLEVDYDYASGDDHPGDGTDNRFDTLYGARRFDFGPTGIYGAVARSNVDTPGLRLEVKPAHSVSAFVGYRAIWLAASRDQWTTAGLQDKTGRSGNFVGHQFEARLRAELVPGNLDVEFGGAYLVHGSYQDLVPGAPKDGNTTYVYSQAVLSF
ncbi:MAG: alginate export family protein [Alphaproteobacteria bacterium]|nr:alginate export family protein [Alphaproteobacteria bacterium]